MVFGAMMGTVLSGCSLFLRESHVSAPHHFPVTSAWCGRGVGCDGVPLCVTESHTLGQSFQHRVFLLVSCRETMAKVVAVAFVLKVDGVFGMETRDNFKSNRKLLSKQYICLCAAYPSVLKQAKFFTTLSFGNWTFTLQRWPPYL